MDEKVKRVDKTADSQKTVDEEVKKDTAKKEKMADAECMEAEMSEQLEGENQVGAGETESCLPLAADQLDLARQYKQMMLIYEAGIRQLTTKLQILNREFEQSNDRNPIETIKTRLKSMESISRKLAQKGKSFSAKSMEENLDDIAGVRVICSFQEDIYTLAKCLLDQDDIELLETKDYIKNPKPSGYRSLHLIVRVPIFLQNEKCFMKVEVQLRTIAMDFWASLEHKLRYKKEIPEFEKDSLQKELFECAQMINTLDQRMEAVKNRLAAGGQWEKS